MPIVNVIKSTSPTNQVKYFNDFMEASFDTQASSSPNDQYKLESCPAFWDRNEDTYTLLIENKDKYDPTFGLISNNSLYPAKKIYHETQDSGGSGCRPTEGYDVIVPLDHKLEFNEYNCRSIQICKANNGKIYVATESIHIEKPAKEYVAIQDQVHTNLEQASKRITAEKQEKTKNLYARQQFLFKKQESITEQIARLKIKEGKLKTTQERLDTELHAKNIEFTQKTPSRKFG